MALLDGGAVMNSVRTREQCEAELAVAQKRFDAMIADSSLGNERELMEVTETLDQLEKELGVRELSAKMLDFVFDHKLGCKAPDYGPCTEHDNDEEPEDDNDLS